MPALYLDFRFRGNDLWDVQRGEAPLLFFLSPKTGGQGVETTSTRF